MPTREELVAQAKQKWEKEQLVAQAKAKWESENRAPQGESEEPGMLESALKTYDSYMGAPARAGIAAAQDGKGVTGALSDAWNQVGADPSTAPTPKDIRQKAGVDLGDRPVLPAESSATKAMMSQPATALAAYILSKASPNDLAEFGIDVAADPTNLIPAGLVGKTAGKLAAKTGLRAASKGVDAAQSTLRRAEDTTARVGKKVLSSHLGPSEESIEYYLKNHERLKDVTGVEKQIEPLKTSIDNTAAPMGEAVQGAAQDLEKTIQAQKDELAELNNRLTREEASLTALKSEKTLGAREKRLMTMDQHKENIRTLSDQVRDQKLRLDEAEKLAAREVAPAVNQAVKRLGDEVSKGSSKSFKILEESGVAVPKSQFTQDLDTVIASMDAEAATDKAVALVNSLKNFRSNLSKFPDQIPGASAKKLIQQLDDEVKYLDGGEKLRGKDGMLQGMRRYLDRQLKVVPEYRKQMVPVARDTRLIKKARNLGDEQSAINLLGRLGKNSSKVEEDTLKALEARFGYDFRSKLNRQNMPEFKQLVQLEERLKSAKHGPEAKRIAEQIKALETSLSTDADLLAAQRRTSDLSESVQRAKDPARVNVKRALLEAKKKEAAPFNKLLQDQHGKTQTQGVINNQLRVNRKTRDIETQRMLESLDAKYGTQYSQKLEDLRHLADFEKEFNRGSTNTNMWGLASGSLGSILGAFLFGPLGLAGGIITGGAGALLGKGMDKFGPEVARVILDQAPTLQKMRPSEWLNSLKIPPAAKAQLEQNLANAGQAVGRTAKGGVVSGRAMRDAGSGVSKVAESDQEPSRAPAKGEAAWMNRGAEKLGLDAGQAKRLMQSREGKELLKEVSDLSPGSPRFKRIQEQIQKGWGGK